MIILCVSASVFQVFLTFLLEINKSKGLNPFAICFIFYKLINAAVIPFYTIGMNYACEITYPVSETMNGGILMIISQLCGIGGTYLFDYLINNKKKQTWLINCIFLLSYIIPFICSFFFDEKLSRYEIDKIEKIKEEVKQVKDNESEPVK